MQKNDPAKYSENQMYLGKMDRYRYKIEQMFSSLLKNPDQQITTDINRDFTYFVKTCIQYFELQEMEKSIYHFTFPGLGQAITLLNFGHKKTGV